MLCTLWRPLVVPVTWNNSAMSWNTNPHLPLILPFPKSGIQKNSWIVKQAQQIVDMVVRKKINLIPQPPIRKFFNTPNFWWLHYRNMGVPLFWIYLAVAILLGLALWSAGQLKRAYDLSGRGRSARLQ